MYLNFTGFFLVPFIYPVGAVQFPIVCFQLMSVYQGMSLPTISKNGEEGVTI